jgi:outer membrane protein OmpA-like peptidoglycan-associated protein
MIRNHLVVGLAAIGVSGLLGVISGCGHTEVAAVVPAAPVATVVVAPPPPPPPPSPKLTAACDSEIRLNGHVHFPHEVEFDVGKATIKPSPTSSAILQCLVDFLNNNKMVTRFRIEGHTDNAGDATQNMTLSQQRAEAIVAWMVGKGINPGMIWAKGYGQTKPLVPNDNPDHMAQNRRVEFHIDELNGVHITKESVALALNPPPPVVTTTAVVASPGVAVAAPAVGVSVVTPAPPSVSIGVAVPTTVGVAVVPATPKKK